MPLITATLRSFKENGIWMLLVGMGSSFLGGYLPGGGLSNSLEGMARDPHGAYLG
jgi:hypothetical protein